MRSCSLMLTWMSIRGKGILSSEYWETTRLSVLSFVEKIAIFGNRHRGFDLMLFLESSGHFRENPVSISVPFSVSIRL